MVISEIAVDLFTNLLSDSTEKNLGKLYTPSSKAYDNAIEKLSKRYNLSEKQIDSFLHQKNVKVVIKEYLENPNNQGIFKSLTDEFLSSSNEDITSQTRASSVLSDLTVFKSK